MIWEGGGLMVQKSLGAKCWRDMFKWVKEGEKYEGRMAGNKETERSRPREQNLKSS